MFNGSYFGKKYFAPRYWSGTGGIVSVVNAVYQFFKTRRNRR
jgi:hypothetical protein